MDKQTIDDLQQLAASEHGRNVLRYIAHDLCGWSSPNITLTTTHDVSLQVMLSRESQRSLWVEIRRHIPKKDLAEIELYEPPQPAAKADETPTTEDELICLTKRQELQQQTQELAEQEGQPEQMLHRQRRRQPMTEPL